MWFFGATRYMLFARLKVSVCRRRDETATAAPCAVEAMPIQPFPSALKINL